MVWFDCWRPSHHADLQGDQPQVNAKEQVYLAPRDDNFSFARAASRGFAAEDVDECDDTFNVLVQSGDEMCPQGAVRLCSSSDFVTDSVRRAAQATPRALVRLVSHARMSDLAPSTSRRAVPLGPTTSTGGGGGGSGGGSGGGLRRPLRRMMSRAGSSDVEPDDLRQTGGGLSTSGGAGGGGGHPVEATCSLLPLHINQALIQDLDASDLDAYGDLLRRLLLRDHALRAVLRKVCADLVAGHPRCVHHTPIIQPVVSPLSGVERALRNATPPSPLLIQSCYCRQADGTLQPSLVIEHMPPVEPPPPLLSASPGGSGGTAGDPPRHGGGGGLDSVRTSFGERSSRVASRTARSQTMMAPTHLRLRALSHSYSGSVLTSSDGGGTGGPQATQASFGSSNHHPGGHGGGGRLGLLPSAGRAPVVPPTLHIAPSDRADMMRGLAALAHCPCVTLLDLDGGVLFQNAASRKYWGSLVATPISARRGARTVKSSQVLQKLFSLQPQWREEALSDVKREAQRWRRVLEVPGSARRWMHSLMRPAAGEAHDLEVSLEEDDDHRGGDDGDDEATRHKIVAAFTPRASREMPRRCGTPVAHVRGSRGLSFGGGGSVLDDRVASILEDANPAALCTSSDLVFCLAPDACSTDILPGSPSATNMGRPADVNTAAAPVIAAPMQQDGRGHMGARVSAAGVRDDGQTAPAGGVNDLTGYAGSLQVERQRSNQLAASQRFKTSVSVPGEALNSFVADALPEAIGHVSSTRRLSAAGASTDSALLLQRQYSSLHPVEAGQLEIQRQYSSLHAAEAQQFSARRQQYVAASGSVDTMTQAQRRMSISARNMASQVMSRAPSNHVMAFVTKAATSDRDSHHLARSWSSRLPRLNSVNINTHEDVADDAHCDYGNEVFGSSIGLSLSINDLGDSAEDEVAWHDLQLIMVADPVSGAQVLLLLQEDVTQRAVLEHHLSALMEAQFSMLEQMFPRHAMEYLMENDLHTVPENLGQLAKMHESVTILFTDIVGFTSMSKAVAPAQVMDLLNTLFTLFDKLACQHSVYKVETAGDCYIVAGGLMEEDKDGFTCVAGHDANPKRSAQRVVAFGKALQLHSRAVRMPHDGSPVQVRVGIHTGPVVTGVIGLKLPKFSVFGTTMNTASRMESTCPIGCVQVSETTMELLKDDALEATGGVEVKGLGMMSTYLWRAPTASADVAATLAALEKETVTCSSRAASFFYGVSREESFTSTLSEGGGYGGVSGSGGGENDASQGHLHVGGSRASGRLPDGDHEVSSRPPSVSMKAVEALRTWRLRALTAVPVPSSTSASASAATTAAAAAATAAAAQGHHHHHHVADASSRGGVGGMGGGGGVGSEAGVGGGAAVGVPSENKCQMMLKRWAMATSPGATTRP